MNKQITEDYCNFEIAKLLKEKGFDIPCREHYYQYGELSQYSTEWHNWNDEEDYYSCPSQSLALKWLREVHRIETHIVLSELNTDNSRKYMFDIYSSDINRDFDSATKEGFNSYEQAVEAALKYTLENLI
jgi:hypothetical protein